MVYRIFSIVGILSFLAPLPAEAEVFGNTGPDLVVQACLLNAITQEEGRSAAIQSNLERQLEFAGYLDNGIYDFMDEAANRRQLRDYLEEFMPHKLSEKIKRYEQSYADLEAALKSADPKERDILLATLDRKFEREFNAQFVAYVIGISGSMTERIADRLREKLTTGSGGEARQIGTRASDGRLDSEQEADILAEASRISGQIDAFREIRLHKGKVFYTHEEQNTPESIYKIALHIPTAMPVIAYSPGQSERAPEDRIDLVSFDLIDPSKRKENRARIFDRLQEIQTLLYDHIREARPNTERPGATWGGPPRNRGRVEADLAYSHLEYRKRVLSAKAAEYDLPQVCKNALAEKGLPDLANARDVYRLKSDPGFQDAFFGPGGLNILGDTLRAE